MNKKAYRILEYNKIIDRLTDHAGSPLGKKLCRELEPMTRYNDIIAAQQETADAFQRIVKKGQLPFYGISDVGPSIKRLEVGGTLIPGELLRLCSMLDNAKRVKTYSRSERDEAVEDTLAPLFDAIEPLTPLAGEIRRCVLSEDEIADDASPGLNRIRRKMKSVGEKIRSQLSAMLGNTTLRSYLQDGVITMRNDRYCLPVKAEYRNQVPGMIHDQSGSGSTLFVEPAAIVNLNNDIRQLQGEEKEEIEKILAELSEQAAQHCPALEEDLKVLTRLDFIFAKAMLALDYNGIMPQFNKKGKINIRRGRHPLLDPKKVVSIDIRLGEGYDLLVVTGPNTGGKTVSLKTAGLLTLMGQAGLHIPAGAHSQLAVFHDVFADIGDEQSIEQSLSTFSAHMTNIVDILKKADYRSLVLFDELCAGTDPTEGAALAIAILTFLHNQQIRTMATTHYSQLKVFALSTDRVENACCEFDVETLSPTYRLLIGIPGKSNAFAISRRLGLPEYIIDDARAQVDTQDKSMEDILADLETSRASMEQERLAIQESKARIKQLEEALHAKNEKIAGQRERVLRQANEEARKLLSDAKAYADETIRSFRKYRQGDASSKEMEKLRGELREKLADTDGKLAAQKIKNEENRQKKQKPEDFQVGSSVRVVSMGMTGTLSTPPNQKGQVYVQLGSLRTMVKLSDLELLAPPQKKETPKSPAFGTMGKASSISPELNLIGMTTMEAIPVLDKYLDDAYLSHLTQARIVHGKGTGALKNAVHQHLKRLSYVKSYRLGVFGEGDSGVTIVEFK